MKMQYRLTFILIGFLGVAACNNGTPLKVSLKEIQDNYEVDGLFSPPRENVSLGTVFRERDKLPLETKCFKGEKKSGDVLSLTASAGKYDTKANFLAEWAGILGLDVKFDSVKEVNVKYGGFSEIYLTNVRPTFDKDCPADVYLGNAKLFASLIKTDNIEIEFKDKDNKKVDLSVEKLKQLADVDLKTGVEINTNKNLQFSGKNLYVAYRKMDYAFDPADDVKICKVGVPCGKVADYEITVHALNTASSGHTATVGIRRLDFGLINVTKTMAPGDAILLKTFPKQKHYFGVRVINAQDGEVELFVSVRRWSLESGPRVMLKKGS